MKRKKASRRIVSVMEEASQVPGAVTVVVPDSWFAALDPRAAKSVWDSLYCWLISEHKIEDPSRQLHVRTRCGRELMVKLLDAERTRLSSGLHGKKLSGAVSFSNCDSGPMENSKFIVSATLIGDALYVAPLEI